MRSQYVLGSCPEDGAMPLWDSVSRGKFYSEVNMRNSTLFYSDSSYTGDDFIGAFSIVVDDSGASTRFEDYNMAIAVNNGAPLDIPGYWNVSYSQDVKTLILAQQEALRTLGDKNGYRSGFPVIISFVAEENILNTAGL